VRKARGKDKCERHDPSDARRKAVGAVQKIESIDESKDEQAGRDDAPRGTAEYGDAQSHKPQQEGG
jgi:hypothetical protein